MKTIRYIFTSAFAFLMVLACVKEGLQEEVPSNESLLKVRLYVPEIEVKSSSDSAMYAYLPSEIKEGILNPISEAIVNKVDGATYYNIPSGTSEVAFTNLYGGDDEKIDISTDKDGNICFSVDTVATSGSYFFDREILAGYIDGVVPGTKEPYDVSIKRLSSKLTTNFRVKDTSGTALSLYDIISSVKVEYSGLGDSAALLSDETITISGNKNEQVYLKAYQANSSSNKLYYHSSNFLPGNEVPSVTVTITRQSGLTQTYTKSLGKKLEPNRHYTVNLSVTNIDSGGSFEVNEPEVTISSPATPSVTEKEFFTISDNLTLAGEVGSELLIDVATVLPYGWDFEFDEAAGQYFTVEQVDGKLRVVVKEENAGDIRYGNVTLKSKTGGYTKTFTLRQFSTRKHEIVMTYKGSKSDRYIYITGENITVQDPDDASPRFYKTANATQVYLNGLSSGAAVTITGDVVKELFAVTDWSANPNYKSEYQLHNGYYYHLNSSYDGYSFEFKNCRYLETFIGCPRNASLDFSQMPDLKKVALGYYSSFSSIAFAEGQSIESFVAYKCPNIQQLNLKIIAETIADIRIYDCDGLLGVNFSDFKNLKSINLNECSNMGQIKLNGCSSLEGFSISNNSATVIELKDCPTLKTIYLGQGIALTKLLHDGSNSLEIVDGYRSGSSWYTTVEELNLSDKTSLKTVSDLIVHDLNVNGCSNLTTLSNVISVKTLDMSNCTSLEKVHIDFWSSSGETYEFDNCPKLADVYFEDMTNTCDFSPLTGLKKVHLENITGTGFTSLDFSKNTSLEDVTIDSDNGSKCKLNSIVLPNSVKSLYVYGLYNIYAIDLSDHTNLASVDIRASDYLNDLNLSGCTALQGLNLYRVYESSSGKLNLSGCSSLISINRNTHDYSAFRYLDEIDLSGCSALEYIDIYNADVSQLDLSDCDKLTYVDVRDNKMSAEALDAMFESLPDWSVIDADVLGIYKITGNPGYSSCDTDIAYVKNWSEVNN